MGFLLRNQPEKNRLRRYLVHHFFLFVCLIFSGCQGSGQGHPASDNEVQEIAAEANTPDSDLALNDADEALGAVFESKQAGQFKCPPGMAKIPAGEFVLDGCRDEVFCEPEQIYRRIKISKAFCMDRYEVTQSQYRKVTGQNPSKFNKHGANCPVERVTWEEADGYCRRVGKRLPTNAEWLHAAWAGANTRFYWGDEVDGRYMWYLENSQMWEDGKKVFRTHPIGKKLPNAHGLYDMFGNVAEFVWDYARFSSRPQAIPLEDPVNRTPYRLLGIGLRTYRGGSWEISEIFLNQNPVRGAMQQTYRRSFLGFRCASDLKIAYYSPPYY